MPFVGKDFSTLEFKRQAHLKELEQKSKNRIYFTKNKEHTKDTGSSLIAGRPQKSTLEQYLDKSKIDENIEKFIVKELGGNSGQAKTFIQGLDYTLKEYLLDRLPAFKRVFMDNFTIPSVINLQSAFELFNRQQLNKIKDIEIPSAKDLQDYLKDLNEQKLYNLGIEVNMSLQRKTRGMSGVDAKIQFTNIFDRAPIKYDYVKDVCINFIRSFDNEIDGYVALSKIGNDIGLRDFPKPNLKRKNEGIPTSRINVDVETIPDLSEEGLDLLTEARRRVGTLPYREVSEEGRVGTLPNRGETDIESGDELFPRIKGVGRYLQLFNNNSKQDLMRIARDNLLSPDTQMSKKDLILYLIQSGYNQQGQEDMNDDEMDILDNHIRQHYNTSSGNQLRPQDDLTEMEGLGYMSKANKPGLVRIFKLRK